MLFNSLDFAIFLPLVFIAYWFVAGKNLKWQNLLVVVASYVFYGWWDWRFLSLIVFSTAIDYLVGRQLGIEKHHGKRKVLLWVSIIVNLGFLGFFKYYNFFLDNFIAAFTVFGQDISARGLDIILPVGISFYTFQTLSYSIDVYHKKLEPTSDFVAFSAFVCFFPQLVAGPIERATNLLPQFFTKRNFNSQQAIDGLYLFIYGLFKKVVIADSCAVFVNEIFANQASVNSITLLLGAVYFAFQIYGDFSGYSDMAIGLSRMFGFELMRNFHFPYFSRDIAEFWRRWHISLSTWFRDYLYFPLGGSRLGKWISVRNTLIIFIVSGFWHGANWTYIAWGGINALLFIPLLITGSNRKNTDMVAHDRRWPHVKEVAAMMGTFFLVTLGWIFFRSATVQDAFLYIVQLFSLNMDGGIEKLVGRYVTEMLPLLAIFLAWEWYARKNEHPFVGKYINAKLVTMIVTMLMFGSFSNPKDFIYFQF